jgi:hypothetical protein
LKGGTVFHRAHPHAARLRPSTASKLQKVNRDLLHLHQKMFFYRIFFAYEEFKTVE